MDVYKELRIENRAGFAEVYLETIRDIQLAYHYSDIVKEYIETNFNIFTYLVALDTKLGTSVSLQLFQCILNTTQSDIIKV